MLQTVKDIQNGAVNQLEEKIVGSKRELTFRAPTGSGKTYMMADFMNRMLQQRSNIVFLVSTLSKGNLAGQNYEKFQEYTTSGMFTALKPYLINTEVSGEETLFIPVDFNVYVLPRDLYKKNGKLMQGAMHNFLLEMTNQLFGQNKKIYLIKDECHQATNNLDDISSTFFEKVINFSATPKLSRGQVPDVTITDEDAVNAKLIKRVELNEDYGVPVEDAIEKLIEIKKDYNNLLQTHPCLIIQISNGLQATEEWERKIKPALDKHQELKWMLIIDRNGGDCDTNDDVKKKLPVSRWRDYAKLPNSTIDIVIFKLVVSEGWDIPRACMLFQVRDTQSKQLDEQVMGRVRRNPRLLDFETLSPQAQELATTAWVWGVKPESMNKTREVKLWGDSNNDATKHIKVKTTKIEGLIKRDDFDVEKFVSQKSSEPLNTSIFELYNKWKRYPNEVQDMCYQYCGNDISKWWAFMEVGDEVKRAYNTHLCDYEKSMKLNKEVSFPIFSSYTETEQSKRIGSWVWCRKDGSGNKFTFDSEAERVWAEFLIDCQDNIDIINGDDNKRFLWGKNFPMSSEIRYEYYDNGIHVSYPDFVMKDKKGRIHIFEVKSVNASKGLNIDSAEYKNKIQRLKECYKACSKILKDHIFYLPILKGDDWSLIKYEKGQEDTISEDQFIESLNK